MNQDSMHEHNNFIALENTVVAGDGTTVGEIIDTFGFESFTFLLMTGAGVTGTLTPLLESSSDAAFGSDVNAVEDKNLLGTEAAAAFAGAGDSDKTSKIGIINLDPTQRYVRLSIVGTDTAAGAIAAQCIKGHGRSDDTYTTQKPMG